MMDHTSCQETDRIQTSATTIIDDGSQRSWVSGPRTGSLKIITLNTNARNCFSILCGQPCTMMSIGQWNSPSQYLNKDHKQGH